MTTQQTTPATVALFSRLPPKRLEELSKVAVERHAVNIYAKIGARGRTDAVAYAVCHHLGDAPPA